MSHKKRNTLTNCFSVSVMICLKNGKFATFVFEVFNLNFNILNVLSQFSLKITTYYRETLFLCIPKYFIIRNSSFQEIAQTKVYTLEDSLGVVLLRNPIFCDFSGGGGGPDPLSPRPSGSAHGIYAVR